MKNIFYLIISILMASCHVKKEELMPNTCQTCCTNPKEMSIVITNTGNTNKTYRIFGANTGLPSVDDNIVYGNPTVANNFDYSSIGNLGTAPIYVQSVNSIFYTVVDGLGNVVVVKMNATTGTTSSVSIGEFGSYSQYLGYNGTGNYIYSWRIGPGSIGPYNPGDIIIIDINSLAISTVNTGTVLGPMENGALVSNNILYIPDDTSSIAAFNTLTNTLSTGIPTSSFVHAFAIGSQYAYAMHTGGIMEILNLSGGTVTSINTGFATGGIAIKYFNNKIYIGSTDYSYISVYDGSTFAFIDNIPLPGNISNGFQSYDNYILLRTSNGVLKINNSNLAYNVLSSGNVAYVNYIPYSNTIYVAQPSGINIFDADNNILLNTISSLVISPIGIRSYGVVSNGNGTVYIMNSSAISSMAFINENITTPVTIVVNGGSQTIQDLNNSIASGPICACEMSFTASSETVLTSSLQKIYKNSTGQIDSKYFNLIANYTAMQPQGNYTVIIKEELKDDCLFDGNHYLQGIIPANSSISIIIKYCQVDLANAVIDNSVYCNNPLVINNKNTKKYIHASFKYVFRG